MRFGLASRSLDMFSLVCMLVCNSQKLSELTFSTKGSGLIFFLFSMGTFLYRNQVSMALFEPPKFMRTLQVIHRCLV